MPCDPIWPSVARHSRPLIEGIGKLVLAVSGGPDSVAMTHLLHTHAGKRFPSLRLHIAHLHHGLRGAEADADAAFVAAFADRLMLGYTIGKADIATLAEGGNWEAAARRERYRFLARVARDVQAEGIATGHTQTDQAETVLLRLLRGAGTDGLAGIHPRMPIDGTTGQPISTRVSISQDQTGAPHLFVIRPLLTTSREDILAYLHRHNLAYRHDATNDDPAFTRNRLRQLGWPVLSQFNPRIAATLARTADQARTDAAYFARLTNQWIANHVVVHPDRINLPVSELQRLPEALSGRVLQTSVALAGWPMPGRRHLEQISQVLLGDSGNGKSIVFPGQRRVFRDGNQLVFLRHRSDP